MPHNHQINHLMSPRERDFTWCFRTIEHSFVCSSPTQEDLDQLFDAIIYLPECDVSALRGRTQDLSNHKIELINQREEARVNDFIKKRSTIIYGLMFAALCDSVLGMLFGGLKSKRLGLYCAVMVIMQIGQQFLLYDHLTHLRFYCRRYNDDVQDPRDRIIEIKNCEIAICNAIALGKIRSRNILLEELGEKSKKKRPSELFERAVSI